MEHGSRTSGPGWMKPRRDWKGLRKVFHGMPGLNWVKETPSPDFHVPMGQSPPGRWRTEARMLMSRGGKAGLLISLRDTKQLPMQSNGRGVLSPARAWQQPEELHMQVAVEAAAVDEQDETRGRKGSFLQGFLLRLLPVGAGWCRLVPVGASCCVFSISFRVFCMSSCLHYPVLPHVLLRLPVVLPGVACCIAILGFQFFFFFVFLPAARVRDMRL